MITMIKLDLSQLCENGLLLENAELLFTVISDLKRKNQYDYSNWYLKSDRI